MFVVCIEGCHGSGKTELCKTFSDNGYEILDEAFLDMPEFSLHPQSLIMETLWICKWFKRLLEKQVTLKTSADSPTIFIADRSPFSAVFYSEHKGDLLDPLIQSMIEDLSKSHIFIYTVLLSVDPHILWKRISKRLTVEPHRKKFNEDDREWMDKVVKLYSEKTWDFVANNNEKIEDTYLQLEIQVQKISRKNLNECY